jgi:PAS domain S-box-containing protein
MNRSDDRTPPAPAGSAEPRRASTRQLSGEIAQLQSENEQLRLTVAALYASEAMLQAVLDSLPVWISVKDGEGRYRTVNRSLLQARNATRADLIGKVKQDTPNPIVGDGEVVDAADAQVLAGAPEVEVPRYTVRLPNGLERQRRLTKLPLRDEEGRLLGVVGWSEDITDAALAEDALEAQRRILRAVIDVVPYPVTFTDADGRLMMVNPAWCRDVGCAAEEMIGLTMEQVPGLPKALRTQLHRDNLEMIQGGTTPPRRTITRTDEPGGARHLVISKAVVPGQSGTVSGIVTVVVDVTDVRQAEQEARMAHQRLVDAMESLPAALYLYDADEKLIVANSNAANYYPAEADFLRPGTSYHEIAKRGIRNVAENSLAQQARLERALRRFRDPPESFEQQLADGRVMLARNRRTSEGGTVSVRFDITEQKRIQRELEQREEQIRADLALAADLQRAILREVQVPPFLEVAWHFQPSSPVSGDLYHASLEPDGAWRFFIGDATGHGVVAAFMTILLETGLRAVPPGTPPAEVLERLNRQLLLYDLDGRFVSGICVRIAPDGQVELANAGHPPALALLRGQDALPLEEASFPLGWFPDFAYRATTLKLQPGDTLLLYTDGLTEWGDQAGEQLGDPAVYRLASVQPAQPPARLVERLLDAARGHAQGQPPGDDLTVFALTYRGPAPG